MNIPEDAIQAACKALREDDRGIAVGPGALRIALEAAAPFIAAQALREAADATEVNYALGSSNDEADFARSDVVDDIRVRASKLESPDA